jgi:hypothetical protein
VTDGPARASSCGLPLDREGVDAFDGYEWSHNIGSGVSPGCTGRSHA